MSSLSFTSALLRWRRNRYYYYCFSMRKLGLWVAQGPRAEQAGADPRPSWCTLVQLTANHQAQVSCICSRETKPTRNRVHPRPACEPSGEVASRLQPDVAMIQAAYVPCGKSARRKLRGSWRSRLFLQWAESCQIRDSKRPWETVRKPANTWPGVEAARLVSTLRTFRTLPDLRARSPQHWSLSWKPGVPWLQWEMCNRGWKGAEGLLKVQKTMTNHLRAGCTQGEWGSVLNVRRKSMALKERPSRQKIELGVVDAEGKVETRIFCVPLPFLPQMPHWNNQASPSFPYDPSSPASTPTCQLISDKPKIKPL